MNNDPNFENGKSSYVRKEIFFKNKLNVNESFNNSDKKEIGKSLNKNVLSQRLKSLLNNYLEKNTSYNYYPAQALRRNLEGTVHFIIIIKSGMIKVKNKKIKNKNTNDILIKAGNKFLNDNLEKIKVYLKKNNWDGLKKGSFESELMINFKIK